MGTLGLSRDAPVINRSYEIFASARETHSRLPDLRSPFLKAQGGAVYMEGLEPGICRN